MDNSYCRLSQEGIQEIKRPKKLNRHAALQELVPDSVGELTSFVVS